MLRRAFQRLEIFLVKAIPVHQFGELAGGDPRPSGGSADGPAFLSQDFFEVEPFHLLDRAEFLLPAIGSQIGLGATEDTGGVGWLQ